MSRGLFVRTGQGLRFCNRRRRSLTTMRRWVNGEGGRARVAASSGRPGASRRGDHQGCGNRCAAAAGAGEDHARTGIQEAGMHRPDRIKRTLLCRSEQFDTYLSRGWCLLGSKEPKDDAEATDRVSSAVPRGVDSYRRWDDSAQSICACRMERDRQISRQRRSYCSAVGR